MANFISQLETIKLSHRKIKCIYSWFLTYRVSDTQNFSCQSAVIKCTQSHEHVCLTVTRDYYRDCVIWVKLAHVHYAKQRSALTATFIACNFNILKLIFLEARNVPVPSSCNYCEITFLSNNAKNWLSIPF